MHARTVIRGLGCAGCGPHGLGPVTQPNKTPFPRLGIWRLNKSWQRSEVSANRAQCHWRSTQDRTTYSSPERGGKGESGQRSLHRRADT